MAWSSAVVTAAELAALALDKPTLVAVQALESPQAAKWDADGSMAGGADISATGYPARWAHDRRTGLRTKPTGATEAPAGTWSTYLCFQLNASPDDFDCIFIQDHNFGTIGGLTVTAEIDDVNTFASGTHQTIATWTPLTSNARLASLVLTHTGVTARRYTGVPYLRIKATKVTAGSFTPEIGEVWVGRRRQLLRKSGEPYDDLGLKSEQSSFSTRTGITTSSVRYKGRRTVGAKFVPSDTTEKSDITAFFRECNYGTRSFIWVENPSSAPASYNLVKLNEPEFVFPRTGPAMRDWNLEASEQGPDFLDVELNP